MVTIIKKLELKIIIEHWVERIKATESQNTAQLFIACSISTIVFRGLNM